MFVRTLFKSILRRKRRKLAAVGAVWVGVTLIVLFLSLRVAVGDRVNAEMGAFGANIVVAPLQAAIPVRVGNTELAPAVSRAYLDESGAEALKRDIFWKNNIEGIVPVLETRARLRTRTVPLVGLWIDHPISLPGGATFRTGARYVDKDWTVNGRWSQGPGECLAGTRLAAGLGIRTGDTVVLSAGGNRSAFHVTGIVSSQGPQDDSILAPLTNVQALAGLPGKVSKVMVSALTTPEDTLAKKVHGDPAKLPPAEYERWSCTAYPEGVALNVQSAFPGSVASVIRRVSDSQGVLLNRIRGLVSSLTLLVVLASMLTVAGVMASTVLDRSREAALLLAIGAGRQSVLAFFLGEAAVLGLAGGLLAAASGALADLWLIETVFGTGGPVPLVVLCLAPALGLLVAVLATAGPVWSVMKRNPALLLHGG